MDRQASCDGKGPLPLRQGPSHQRQKPRIFSLTNQMLAHLEALVSNTSLCAIASPCPDMYPPASIQAPNIPARPSRGTTAGKRMPALPGQGSKPVIDMLHVRCRQGTRSPLTAWTFPCHPPWMLLAGKCPISSPSLQVRFSQQQEFPILRRRFQLIQGFVAWPGLGRGLRPALQHLIGGTRLLRIQNTMQHPSPCF